MDTIDLLLLITFVILAFNFVIFISSICMMKKRKKEFEKRQMKIFDDDFL
ncbi:hypothetical protein ACOMOA_001878 [Enterococcus faecalis]|nr:hypothetical protein [Enterococcus faecalis]EGO2582183.1 hypothetical protein [Enterococcus faecalis]EGO2659099.1 hypothetical protein [Enterococcus faecalis]EGO2741128.1 hypothetical protein [Enterococcus faecalis]EGO2831066.1 hypothetical protein [Enterococcus faecalis]EGO5112111.1 hypothetical protein [Enterococcus faecalis]